MTCPMRKDIWQGRCSVTPFNAVACSRDVAASHSFFCCGEQQRRWSTTTVEAVRFALVVEYVVQLPQCLTSVDEYTAPARPALLLCQSSSLEYQQCCFAPAPVVEYIAPAASHVTPAPADECIIVVECVSPAPAVNAAPTPSLCTSRPRQQWTLHLHRLMITLRLHQLWPTRCLPCPLRRLLCS